MATIRLCKKSELPAEAPVVSRMAYYIQLYRRQGQNLSPEIMNEIAGRVRQDFRLWSKAFLEKDPDERLLEDLDGPLLEKIRKADLKRLKAKGLNVGSKPEDNTPRAPKPDKKMSMSEWLDHREERLDRGR